MRMRRGAFANLYFSPPDLWRAVFVPSCFRFAPCRLRAAFAPCRLRAAKLSSRRVAGVFFADALQAALAPYSLAGGFCSLFSCAALRSRTRGGHFAPLALRAAEFFCSLSLQGGRIFTYYSTSAAERQSYLAAKFVSPQNAPFRTQNAFAFFTEEAFCTARAGVKSISSPPRPSAAGGAGPSALLLLRPLLQVGAFCRFPVVKRASFCTLFPFEV